MKVLITKTVSKTVELNSLQDFNELQNNEPDIVSYKLVGGSETFVDLLTKLYKKERRNTLISVIVFPLLVLIQILFGIYGVLEQDTWLFFFIPPVGLFSVISSIIFYKEYMKDRKVSLQDKVNSQNNEGVGLSISYSELKSLLK